MTGWTLGGWFVLRHAGLPFDWIERLGADEHLLRAADEVLDAGTATDATARYERAYAEAYRELERELHRLAAEPLVEEAVFVSAPDMWRNVWRRYVSDTEPATTSDARRTHRKVYTYLQRFCAKNETTSFFGPLGYGEVDAAADGPGARLCRDEPTRRLVYFAHWAVVELARVMRRDRALLPALPVAVAEPERLSGVAGGGATGKLAADLCDGGTPTVGALAARHGGLGTTLRALAPLLHSGVAELGPLYAGGRADEFDRLRAALAELDSGEAADRWVRRLADLDRLREEYRTTGFPDRVSVLDRLEARFTEVTGQPARRGGGIYADRYVVYEECRSPFRLTIGGAAAARLTDAVQAALTFSAAYGDLVQRRHRAWVLERWPADRATMPLPEYAERLCGDGDWSTRFDAGVEVPRPPPAPLPGPRYALPDICLAARTVDDLAAGRFDVVVARVHHHLLLDSWLAVAHPDPAEFARPAATWVRRHAEPAGLLGAAVSRRNKGFYVYPGEQVALRHQRAVETAGAGPLRPASTFTVTREPDGPRLRDAAGRERRLYLPLADLTGYPPLAALSAPPVLHARFGPAAGAGAGVGAVAEVRLDGAVYQRRRWHVEAPGARGLTPAARFLAVRRLVRQYGLPRFVYVRSDRDRKPYLLDTCSPLAVELFAHRSRPGEHVQLEQMSPGADQLWLTDAAGRRYTCELRMPAFTEGGCRSVMRLLDRFVLRGAGFEFDDARLPGTGAGSLAARLAALDVEADCFAALLVAELAGLEPDRAARRPVKRAVRRREPLPTSTPYGPLWSDLTTAWNALAEQRSALRARYADAVDAEIAAADAHLRSWCARPGVAEALWSSHPGPADLLRRYAQHAVSGGQPRRLALRYLQRFATKNETASFFGPFQFGDVTAVAGARALLVFDPESPRLSERVTAPARFVVDELADLAAAELGGDPTVPMRPHPLARLHDGVLRIGDRRIALPAALAGALADGPVRLAALPEAVRPAAGRLVNAGILRADLRPPTTSLRPLAELAGRLTGRPGAAGERWRDRVGQVRDGIAALQTEPWPARRDTIAKLGETVKSWGVRVDDRPTGLYADRSVVYDECRGGLRGLALNADAFAAHIPAVEVVLRVHAAHAAAVRARTRLWLAAEWTRLGLPDRVNLADLLAALGEQPVPVLEPGPAGRALWDRLAALAPAGTTEVRLTADAVYRAFAGVLPDEPFLCSPDFLVRRRPGMADGLVLGEVHHGSQVWCWLAATLDQHERDAIRQRLTGWADLLRGDARLATLVEPRFTGKTFTIELPGLAIERMGRSALPAHLVRALHEVTADRTTMRLSDAQGPLVLAPSSPVDPIVSAFGGLVLWGPRSPGAAAHQPRVLVDDLVWWRESWRLSAEDLDALVTARTPAEALYVVARLRADLGLPRYAYVRVSGEPKPVFADLTSAAYCDMLSRLVAKHAPGVGAPLADVTETLPEPVELALSCAERRYTSELRTTVLVGGG